MGSRPKGRESAPPIPEVDESVRREARNVGLVAVLFAAGISAQALYSLGLLIGLSPWTAWMLPGAMDLYAFESTRVASRVPARHPSRSWAVWNARLALSFTVAGNALFHALHLASGHRGWTDTDIALTAVSAIPPVIVERFLHLQTKINATAGATAPATPATTPQPVAGGATPRSDATSPRNDATPVSAQPQQPPATANSTTIPVARNTPAKTARINWPAPHDERARIITELIKTHGRDNVTGAMVGEALGVDRTNGYRALQRVLKQTKTKPETSPAPATDDETEHAAVAR